MMSARQILLLFGFFLSMFYIFKYGGTLSVDRQSVLCSELHHLQAETITALSPLIRADNSPVPFDKKMDTAMKTLRGSSEHISRQNKIWTLQRKLSGHICPAPSMVQMAKIAAGT